MRLVQLSIQNSLFVALLLLLAMFSLSSIVSWRAFDQVSQSQRVLLDETLPAMQLVNRAVNDGVALLDIGDALSRPVSKSELVMLEQEARRLSQEVKGGVGLLLNSQLSSFASARLDEYNRYLFSAIDEQVRLQHLLVGYEEQAGQQVGQLLSAMEKAQIDIKVVESNISRQLIDSQLQDSQWWQNKLSTLTHQRFGVQQIKSLLSQTLLENELEQVERAEDLYRLQVKKLSLRLLEFSPNNRKMLSSAIAVLNDQLVADRNFFRLKADKVHTLKQLRDAKDRIVTLNSVLVEEYQKLLDYANLELDTEGKQILQAVGASKLTIVIVVLLCAFAIVVFSLLFVKPKIINRIMRLTDNTRAIANGQYDIDIELDGGDEVSAMAQSLYYFRTQLVEKDEFQRALAEREQTLSIIIENAAEGLMTVDIEGFIQTFNPACEKMFDVFSEEAVTHKVDDFLPDQQSLFLTHGKQAPTPAEGLIVCQDQVVKAKKANGEVFDGSLSVSLVNFSGKLVYSCFIRDVTQEKKAKAQVDQLINELSSSNADLESFAYSCSHDLQEPVRIISAFSQLLKEHVQGQLDEKGERYLGFIERSAAEAKNLIKGILEYSRLDSVATQKQLINIDVLCMRVHEGMSMQLQERGGCFEWKHNGVQLHAVESQLYQVLSNLVLNGLKYNTSERPTVTLVIEEQESAWLFVVSDNGVGIDARYHEQIFELFNRLVNRKDYSGSGIGLALCKKIVGRHGGKIWLESALGSGSQFYIQLPKQQEV